MRSGPAAVRTVGTCISGEMMLGKGAWNQGTIKKDTWVYMTATYDGKNTLTIYENGAENRFR